MSGLFKFWWVLLIFISVGAMAQCPANIGVEDGTFTNWTAYAGSVDKTTGALTLYQSTFLPDRHVIVSAAAAAGQLDPYGRFPLACPNGSKYSIKLGNEQTGAEAERLTYDIKIPAGQDYTLIFNYAVVLENPGHPPALQPRFTVKVYDVTDSKDIDCPAFDFVSSTDLPGFKLSPTTVDGPGGAPTAIFYKEWSKSTIHLVGYGGKTVQLQFTTNDCAEGGHFGYAYIDIDEDCNNAITGNNYCSNQDSITLHAPPGFSNYIWYTGDMHTKVGEGEALTVIPPPANGTKYAVQIIPYLGLGCTDTLYTTINKLDEDFKLQVKASIRGCLDGTVDLTAPAVTAGSSPGLQYSYLKDPVTEDYLPNPDKVTKAGTYYIKAVNAGGCMDIQPVTVTFSNPALTLLKTSITTQYPEPANLGTIYLQQPGLTYGYYIDSAETKPVADYTAVSQSGTYYIKATDSIGCSTTKSVRVTIGPPAPYTITAPTAFTPNGDGINDYFYLTLDGYIALNRLSVYDRSGQVVYTSTSVADRWDGTLGGQRLPVGTYYWVFEGTDLYYQAKAVKSGSITIVR